MEHTRQSGECVALASRSLGLRGRPDGLLDPELKQVPYDALSQSFSLAVFDRCLLAPSPKTVRFTGAVTTTTKSQSPPPQLQLGDAMGLCSLQWE